MDYLLLRIHFFIIEISILLFPIFMAYLRRVINPVSDFALNIKNRNKAISKHELGICK